MAEHHLKTWPEPFAALLAGTKVHEVRRNDRGFEVGDTLVLCEWSPLPRTGRGDFTGRELRRVVSYISSGGTWGLPDDLCVMSLAEPKRDLCARLVEAMGETSDLRVSVDFYANGDVVVRDRDDRRLLDTSDGEVGGEANDDAIVAAVKGVSRG